MVQERAIADIPPGRERVPNSADAREANFNPSSSGVLLSFRVGNRQHGASSKKAGRCWQTAPPRSPAATLVSVSIFSAPRSGAGQSATEAYAVNQAVAGTARLGAAGLERSTGTTDATVW